MGDALCFVYEILLCKKISQVLRNSSMEDGELESKLIVLHTILKASDAYINFSCHHQLEMDF